MREQKKEGGKTYMLEYYRNNRTGDVSRVLTNSPDDKKLVKEFIKEHYNGAYTLTFFDSITGGTIEIDNEIKDIKNDLDNILTLVFLTECTFVHWVETDSKAKSYVISIDVNKGVLLEVGHGYHYERKSARFTKIL